MILIACIDDDNGMMFNHRRQSQDRVLRERVLKMTDGSRLWMNHYSARQFESDSAAQINIDDNFLNEAAPGEYCFVEDLDVSPYKQWVEKIVLFKWNRRYPSDLRFNISINDHGWKLRQSTDFAGSSHEKITEEVYTK